MHKTDIDAPEELIKKVMYQFEPNIKRKNIEAFTIRHENKNVKIKADWFRYELILFNIIQNAIKYN